MDHPRRRPGQASVSPASVPVVLRMTPSNSFVPVDKLVQKQQHIERLVLRAPVVPGHRQPLSFRLRRIIVNRFDCLVLRDS